MEQDQPSGRHQNTRRIATVLDCLAANPDHGARLVDICNFSGLGKGTVHRILAGLTDANLAQQDTNSGRFFIGPRVINWARATRRRSDLGDQLKPALQEICDLCGDTVYLAIRQGDEAVYIARYEGTYPLKALPVEVGARRPIGIGAAPMAILAFQPQEEIERIIDEHEADRARFKIGNELFRNLIKRAQDLNYSLHLGEVLPGMIAVGVPIVDVANRPIAAISVAAGADRLQLERREEVVAMIRTALARHPLAI